MTPVLKVYQTWAAMSALPPKADMCTAQAHVCFGPIADISYLFDHLVGTPDQRVGDSDTEGFGCL